MLVPAILSFVERSSEVQNVLTITEGPLLAVPLYRHYPHLNNCSFTYMYSYLHVLLPTCTFLYFISDRKERKLHFNAHFPLRHE